MLSRKILEAHRWKNSLDESDVRYIWKVLEKLPEDSKVIIFLRYWRNIEFDEIAETLGLSLRKIKFIHDMTLRLLSKVFLHNLNDQKTNYGR